MLPADRIDGADDAALQLHIEAAKDMIDGFCGRTFPDGAIPSIVKSVSLDLIRVLLTDITKQSESIGGGDYSFTQNNDAFNQILARLKYIKFDEGSLADKGRTVKVRVV
jgi:hypothetical protein